MPILRDYIGALHLCCAHARDAAQQERFVAAHGLFQSAVIFYDRAQKIADSLDELPFDDSLLAHEISALLLTARAELDDSAVTVYPDNSGPSLSSRHQKGSLS